MSVFLSVLLPTLAVAQVTVTGVVKDAETKEPLPGVVVSVKGLTTVVTTTVVNGSFTIVNVPESSTLQFRLLSYKPFERKISAKETVLEIMLEPDETALKEVVIEAGIIKRDKFGFTGSYSTISQEDLKSVGNINVLQSLKSLDPSFVIVEDNLSGSNPNAMANIELRGQTSMNITSVQDAAAITSNLPLFILDGFEASLQEINDLDINRIESITLLKDAGSTAIYGVKGANGVVVIETVKPKAGQIFVSYNGDFQVAAPDLSVYNLMNAREKLEFERLAGRYNLSVGVDVPELGTTNPHKGNYSQKIYYERLALVNSGVDTYWLSEPVRTAFTQSHSATISGGKELQYIAGLNYRSNPGVMKGSERDTYGGNLRLVYRGMSGLSIQNNISVQGTAGMDGSWGSFSDFANANPYYKKINSDGSIPKDLDNTTDDKVSIYAANPLYNAMLNSRGDNNVFIVTNNTSIDWKINKDLLVKGSLSLKHESSNSVDFKDPSHSSFEDKPYYEKGTYKSSYTTQTSYSVNLSANYLKSIKKNNFTAIARANIEETNRINESFVAVGFPEGSVGYPSQSFSYKSGSRPVYSERMTRNVGFIGAFNYNYDYRYLLDLNYNIEGSSNFGRNKRFQSFWSAGLGWNIDREAFVKNWKWLNRLKLRATYGMNGTQSVNVITQSVYSYYVGNSVFGQSSYLSEIGNPDLRWQIVTKKSAGMDLSVLNGNLDITLDMYKHETDPQVVQLTQKPSTGVPNYPLNLGYLDTEGYEFKLMYNIINRKENNALLSIRLTGAHTKSVYGGFGNALQDLSNAYQKEENSKFLLQSLQHYMDGNSPTDLWAVRSLGIDPATGREIFLTAEGKQTYIYDPKDRVVIANTRPDIQGIIGLTARYRKLTFTANLRYYTGAYSYNSALFNKVENIFQSEIIYNQDKRALYDRWKKAGDIAQFRSIAILNNSNGTPVSSRFIQKNNYLRGESVKLMWNFTGEKWLNTLKLKDLSASVSMSDFFNISSIKMERGIDYPFQRAVTANISARF
ncbi:MAG: SusC/RagA family TonB-linked outer membrane protein [Dysgonamonadaceae bacterium]|nr:SusC/RagA family TonB-linked outer membrane protein [Dysgonamonadaceae bacterium]